MARLTETQIEIELAKRGINEKLNPSTIQLINNIGLDDYQDFCADCGECEYTDGFIAPSKRPKKAQSIISMIEDFLMTRNESRTINVTKNTVIIAVVSLFWFYVAIAAMFSLFFMYSFFCVKIGVEHQYDFFETMKCYERFSDILPSPLQVLKDMIQFYF